MHLHFAFSDKRDGNMSFRHESQHDVDEHRRRFFAQYGIDLSSGVMMQLTHEDTITVVNSSDAGNGMTDSETAVVTEALMTKTPGLVLCLLIGDCFPVIYYDRINNAVALAHLGWKPATLKLAGKVVRAMHTQHGSNLSDISVIIGPGIHAQSYMLSDPLQATLPEWQSFISETAPNTYAIDLLGFILNDLTQAGIIPENIDTSHTYDTATNPAQFSHFRSDKTGEPEGRFLACAWMEE